jgi:hypothetical protein
MEKEILKDIRLKLFEIMKDEYFVNPNFDSYEYEVREEDYWKNEKN